MKILENRILRDARVLDDDVLKVDSFLTEQIDVGFITELANEFCIRFSGCGATKVLTAAPGSAAALLTASKLEIPMIYARRSGSCDASPDAFTGKIVSYTNSEVYDISVSHEFLSRNDRVLIICDFLSKGNEILGLTDIAKQAGAELCGVGVVIEKSYLSGAKALRETGVRVESLARIESMSRSNGIRFLI